MLEKLKTVKERHNELSAQLADSAALANQETYRQLSKEYADLGFLAGLADEASVLERELADARELAEDPELRIEAEAEIVAIGAKFEDIVRRAAEAIVIDDPDADRNCIIEIRAGTGGEEAALFAAELLRMYTRFTERRGWKSEMLDLNETGIGGLKEAVLSLHGRGAYGDMKYESGVHRVQRVPETESSGRIHTSAATVAVLPEAEEVEVEIDVGDIEIDTYRSGSAGGQHVNKTDSAVRITHLPSGIVVQCQDERSQHQNKQKAMRFLRAKLLDRERQAQADAIASERRSQVKGGDRSEKIRTYNYPQSRITDHRIGFSTFNFEAYLDGDLEDMIARLKAAAAEEQLQNA